MAKSTNILQCPIRALWRLHHEQMQLCFRVFSNSAPKLWNALPRTIREADSSATFRRRLKTHLFSDWLLLFRICWTHCASKLFCVFPRLSVHFWSIISFSALSIQVNGTVRYENGHHHPSSLQQFLVPLYHMHLTDPHCVLLCCEDFLEDKCVWIA